MRMMIRGLLLVAAILVSSGADAAYIIDFSQVGTTVVATGSGSINYTALRFEIPTVTGSGVNAALGSLMLGTTNDTNLNRYSGTVRSARSFGIGGMFNARSGTGEDVKFRFDSGYVYLPIGYVSGSELGTSTTTFANSTFTSLGLTSGMYTMHWGSGSSADFAVVNIPVIAAVPEPTTWAMMLVGFGMVAATARYRRCKTIAVYS